MRPPGAGVRQEFSGTGRFGVRLLDMKEPSYTVFELDGIADRPAWVRERCGASPA